MELISLNSVINKERKYYGFKLFGLMSGAVFGLLVLMMFNMTVGIVGIVIGYWLGVVVSNMVHTGRLQRIIYWYLPTGWLVSNQYLPPSHIRQFM